MCKKSIQWPIAFIPTTTLTDPLHRDDHLYYIYSFSLAFGDTLSGFLGNPATYAFYNNVGAAPNTAISATIPLALFSLFQLKFAIITPALISGALAERVRFTAYMVFCVLFSIFIYSPL